MTEEVDEFLMHFGVKGMHWGQAKAAVVSGASNAASASASAAKTAARATGAGLKSQFVTKPREQIAEQGKAKVALKTAGKTVAAHVLINVGGHAVGQLVSLAPGNTRKYQVKKGLRVATAILSTGSSVYGTAKTAAVLASKSSPKKESDG